MATTAIKTRIQLKNDTEAHWLLATNFVPLQGEVIIYSADGTHPFSRLKVGDGTTTVNNLPFIDSGSTNNFVLKENLTSFPAIGEPQVLYLDISSNTIYEWTNNSGYTAKYGVITVNIQSVLNWDAGTMTILSLDNNNPILNILNGTEPTLTLTNNTVVTGFGALQGGI